MEPIIRPLRTGPVARAGVREFGDDETANVGVVEVPARLLATQLHWFEGGGEIGLVQRDHCSQSYEFFIFALVERRYIVVHEGCGISDRFAACSQVMAALECKRVAVDRAA